MKIRRYTCKDMQEALLKVKMDLGSEAVIMNSRKVKPKGIMGLFSKPMIEVVAAIDDDYVKPSRHAYQQKQQAYNAYAAQPPADQHPTIREHKTAEIHSPSSGPNVADARVGEAKAPFVTQEDQKIADLENKVKSMESMLDQIYKAVRKNEPEEEKDHQPAETQTPEPQAPVAEPVAPVSPATPAPAAESTIGSGSSLAVLQDMLFEHDVEPRLIDKILEKIRERGGSSLGTDEVFNLAARVMTVLLGEPEPMKPREDKKPHVAIFLGPTGVGKTTTLAKIAADFTLNKQKKVGLITADTYRIAAVEQLKTYAEILNLQVNVVYSPNEIKEAVERLSDNDLILIDTAGRSHRNKTHFDELKMLANAVNADETYLVVSCNTSRAAIREILEYYAFIRNYKLIFTKLDESPVPGIILNARYMTGKPLSYTTAGQSVPDDLSIANVKQLVAGILGKGSIQLRMAGKCGGTNERSGRNA